MVRAIGLGRRRGRLDGITEFLTKLTEWGMWVGLPGTSLGSGRAFWAGGPVVSLRGPPATLLASLSGYGRTTGTVRRVPFGLRGCKVGTSLPVAPEEGREAE